jgi:hypothetical protein
VLIINVDALKEIDKICNIMKNIKRGVTVDKKYEKNNNSALYFS